MRLWGEDTGLCMQFIHGSYAFGAFLAPLIAKPFITEIPATNQRDGVFNISCSSIEASFCGNISLEALSEECNKTSSAVITVTNGNFSKCSVSEVDVDKYGWVYWIAAMVLVPPLLAFTYFAVRYEAIKCFKKCASRDKSKKSSSDCENKLQKTTSEMEENKSSSESATLKTYKYPAFFFLFWFMLFYVRVLVWRPGFYICCEEQSPV